MMEWQGRRGTNSCCHRFCLFTKMTFQFRFCPECSAKKAFEFPLSCILQTCLFLSNYFLDYLAHMHTHIHTHTHRGKSEWDIIMCGWNAKVQFTLPCQYWTPWFNLHWTPKHGINWTFSKIYYFSIKDGRWQIWYGLKSSPFKSYFISIYEKICFIMT
jgi:hypothetical protein